MKSHKQLSATRLSVLISSLILFISWLTVNFSYLTSSQNGTIRFFLTLFFALLILFRSIKDTIPFYHRFLSSSFLLFYFFTGTFLAIIGIIFNIHQIEWLGLMIILFACLEWSLPKTFSLNICLSFFLLYWAHPLPNQIFAFLQFTMQKISVNGSEWLLHMLNVRVWADNFVLRTGVNIYEIPEWCSGARTATTVFLLTLGLGILKRMKWFEIPAFIIIAIIQALILNIVRISLMVILTPKFSEWTGLLHDTAGIIMILAVFLVYFEISLLENMKKKQADPEREKKLEDINIFSEYPPFWTFVIKHKKLLFTFLLFIVLFVGLAFKSRPFHHAEMIKVVAESLRDTGNLEEAQKAAYVVQHLVPDDRDWQLVTIRILLMRNKFEKALKALNKVANDKFLNIEKNILKAYSLMGLNRIDEASSIIKKLPEHIRLNDPRVAMILAEQGFYMNDIDKVVDNIITASKWKPNIKRIRNLYPYMRIYKKWDAIISSNIKAPYVNPAQAFSAAEAYMNLNDVVTVADISLQAISAWPENPGVLELLFFMAIRRENDIWEKRFSSHMLRTIKVIYDVDKLYNLFNKCFYLARPDLAWRIYQKISEIDPSHPALYMCVVKYGASWFLFRKRFIGIPSERSEDKINIKPFYIMGKLLNLWQPLCENIPLGKKLSVENTIPVRKRFLKKAIIEFQKRDSENRLSLPMQYEYVAALEISGDIDTVHTQLKKISLKDQKNQSRKQIILSEIYERKADWNNVYETLRNYTETENPSLPPLLRLCKAQLKLHMGLSALYTARKIVNLFPYSSQVVSILASTLMVYDSYEEALFVLSQPRIRNQRDLDIIEAESLYMTHRFVTFKSFCRSHLLPGVNINPAIIQELELPPAELSVIWHLTSIPSESDFAKNADTLKKNLKDAKSPFLKKMIQLWLKCYETKCVGKYSNPEIWQACGRDNMEKGIALNQLTLLLCKDEKWIEAREVATQAVKFFPKSPHLWRILIGLSNAKADIIKAARIACPTDSEIWLADIVVRTQTSEKGKDDWVMAEISKATKLKTFSPATMTRIGDYLFRFGLQKASVIATKDAIARAKGLLPAYVLGIKCALRERNKEWALKCTKKTIEASLKPLPVFYEKLVELKLSEGKINTDNNMVQALKSLCNDKPNDPLWAQMLGYVRFKRGGWEVIESINDMIDAIDKGAINKTPYLVAAEASRIFGNMERAIDLLHKGLKQHPNNLIMLNNLIYTLACSKKGINEAVELLPELIRLSGRDPRVIDTVALVYLRSGQLDKAFYLSEFIQKHVEKNTLLWLKARIYLAEIMLYRNKPEQAIKTLKETIKYTGKLSHEDIITINNLISEAQVILAKKHKSDRSLNQGTSPDIP